MTRLSGATVPQSFDVTPSPYKNKNFFLELRAHGWLAKLRKPPPRKESEMTKIASKLDKKTVGNGAANSTITIQTCTTDYHESMLSAN